MKLPLLESFSESTKNFYFKYPTFDSRGAARQHSVGAMYTFHVHTIYSSIYGACWPNDSSSLAPKDPCMA
jgi:hypothetical protein